MKTTHRSLALILLATPIGMASCALDTPDSSDLAEPIAETSQALVCVQPPETLVDWWMMDESAGTTVHDTIATDNAGSAVGGPAIIPGKVGNARSFDGINDYISVPTHVEVNIVGPSSGYHESFTIDAWIRVNPANAAGLNVILDKRVNPAQPVGYSLYLSNGYLGFQMADGSAPGGICGTGPAYPCTNWVATSGYIPDGNWHLVAVKVDQVAGVGTFSVDGVALDTFTPRTGSMANGAPLQIGRRHPTFGAIYFKGDIDELELFKSALPQQALTDIYTADSAGKCKITACGDGLCESPEDCCTCPSDCGTCSGCPTATALATGSGHTCAVIADGTVRCWGENSWSKLGNAGYLNVNLPTTVNGISTAVAVGAADAFTCVMLAGGAVQCWGYNYHGELGDGTTTASTAPVTVLGVTATSLAVGYQHSCALLAGGTIKCWGRNGSGQLGDGTTTDAPTAVTVSGINNAVALSLGVSHSCAVLASGTIQCWGNNSFGQFGNGTTTSSNVPVTVSGISTATSIGAGSWHNCASLASGAVQCWGFNPFGQLGNGTTVTSTLPVTVSGISTATNVTAGVHYSCALLSGGTAACWGINGHGNLGNGANTDAYTPVSVVGSGFATIHAGGAQTCALTTAGATLCWGWNGYGQLGNGTNTSSNVPTSVFGL